MRNEIRNERALDNAIHNAKKKNQIAGNTFSFAF